MVNIKSVKLTKQGVRDLGHSRPKKRQELPPKQFFCNHKIASKFATVSMMFAKIAAKFSIVGSFPLKGLSYVNPA